MLAGKWTSAHCTGGTGRTGLFLGAVILSAYADDKVKAARDHFLDAHTSESNKAAGSV